MHPRATLRQRSARAPLRLVALVLPLLATGCGGGPDARALKTVNAIDETNLSDIMLTVADPQEAVNYFTRTSQQNPDRIDLQRGLARSLVRNGQAGQAAGVWARVASMPGATADDGVAQAEARIRAGDWKGAEAVLNTLPPTQESYDRYRIEAMVADARQNWAKADSFYDIAAGLTARPAGVLNNWGYSKLSRGDAAGAEKLFGEALRHDPAVFTTKNNLILARAAQRKYDLPVLEMTQGERARLLYTAALSAIKKGDLMIGRSILQEAVETSPSYFEEAARALAALDAEDGPSTMGAGPIATDRSPVRAEEAPPPPSGSTTSAAPISAPFVTGGAAPAAATDTAPAPAARNSPTPLPLDAIKPSARGPDGPAQIALPPRAQAPDADAATATPLPAGEG